MAQFFISYSRADAQFIGDLVPLLHETYGFASVFYDEQIPGGAKWWEVILEEIAVCELFIYLCSEDSLQSTYCQSELREAVRLHKRLLPIIVRPKTNYPYAGVGSSTTIPADIAQILRDTNCIDLSRGFRDRELGPKAAAKLYGAINKALGNATSNTLQPLTPNPTAQPQLSNPTNPNGGFKPLRLIVAAMITGMIAILALIIPLVTNGLSKSEIQETTLSPSPITQEIAAAILISSETPAPTSSAAAIVEPSNTPQPSATFSDLSLTVFRSGDSVAVCSHQQMDLSTLVINIGRNTTYTIGDIFPDSSNTLADSCWCLQQRNPVFTIYSHCLGSNTSVQQRVSDWRNSIVELMLDGEVVGQCEAQASSSQVYTCEFLSVR